MGLKIGGAAVTGMRYNGANAVEAKYNGAVVWPDGPVDNRFYIEARSAGATVKITPHWADGEYDRLPTLRYSVDGGTTYQTYAWYATKTLANIGDRIYFCGDNAAIAISSETYINFAISGADIYGSIEYLRDSTGRITAVPDWCYYKLFADCRGIHKAPELPATELGASAYRAMFINCEYLTDAPPTLPALTLSEYCYGEMFSDCHRMVKAPEMMAETLARYSCAAMFIDCSYLREITVHFAAWPASSLRALSLWVENVDMGHSGGTFRCPESLPAEYGTSKIPTGWTVVNI